MVMALVFKVGTLVVKTLAKPIGSFFEGWALQHPVARKYIINTSQVLHRFEISIARGAEGKTGKAFIGDMTEEKSIQLASKVASEGFVFTVGVLVLTAEYGRNKRKEDEKKAKAEAEKAAFLAKIEFTNETALRNFLAHEEAIKTLGECIKSLEEKLWDLERAQRASAEQKSGRGFFGGFFGPRALA